MALMVRDAYYPDDQETFRDGFATINPRSNEVLGSDFIAASAQNRRALLEALDAEQHEFMERRVEGEPA